MADGGRWWNHDVELGLVDCGCLESEGQLFQYI